MQEESGEEEDLLAGTDHSCFSLAIFAASAASFQGQWSGENGARPVVPRDHAACQGLATTMDDPAAGKHIGRAIGRRSSIPDKTIGFLEIKTWRIADCGLGGRDEWH